MNDTLDMSKILNGVLDPQLHVDESDRPERWPIYTKKMNELKSEI